MNEMVIFTIASIVFIAITIIVTRQIIAQGYRISLAKSYAQIKLLESKIEEIKQNKSLELQKEEIQFNKNLELKEKKLDKEYKNKMYEARTMHHELESKLKDKLKHADSDLKQAELAKNQALRFQSEQEKILEQYNNARIKALDLLSSYTSLTKQDAKKQIFEYLEQDLSLQKANTIRRYENEALAEAKKRANYIIANATTRYAGEFANEKLVNVVQIPNDELKGRIIGKEGRNIKTLEHISGVDVIIDDTPNAIILSSFNLYRRAIATKTLEALILDGRIQPSIIEEIYKKTKLQMEEITYNDGDSVVLDLGLGSMHDDLKKLIGKLKYRASFGQNALAHSVEVARLAGIIACELGGDEKLARRAGLLHDIGKSLTQERGGNHVDLGAEICRQYDEHPVVLNAVLAHHGHEESKSIECSAVCTADVLSAARPGARMEVIEGYLNRLNDLEKIATSKKGVKQAYAVQGGRELRVIVRANVIDDNESVVLARDIAKEVQTNLKYPGEVKISVIRETRAVEFAR